MSASAVPSHRAIFLRGLGLAVAAGVFFALAGVFGTAAVPLAPRLAYWLAVMVGGALWGDGASYLTRRSAWLVARPWLHGTALTAALALPISAYVGVLTEVMFHQSRGPLNFVGPVVLISATMVALNLLINRQPTVTHAARAGGAPPPFLQRMPAKLRGAELHAVEAEDHYLRLHTDRGSDLILMRLADAVAELEGLEGARTHRSWWVARSAVRGARRGDGRATLILEGGLEAAVSRRYARALREAGWY